MMKIINSLDDLEPNLCALLQVDPDTGVPLNEKYKWAISDDAAYYCFANMEDARHYALQQLTEHKLTEWSLFDSNGAYVETINNSGALIENASKKKRGVIAKVMDFFNKKEE